MIVRLAAIVLALLVSAQTSLVGGTIQVCRYTGKRMAPCPCPRTKPIEDDRILPQGCCELRESPQADLAGALPVIDSRLPLLALAWPDRFSSWLPPEPVEAPGRRARPGHDPPPRERLFLSLRQLLI